MHVGPTPAHTHSHLFSEAVTGLVSSKHVPINALVEIGPPALKGPSEPIVKEAVNAVAKLKRQEDGRRSMLRCIRTLFTLNASVNIATINASTGETV